MHSVQQAITHFQTCLLGNELNIDQILTDYDQHPGNFTLETYRTIFFLYSQDSMHDALLNQAFERLAAYADTLSLYERLFLEGLEAWRHCDYWRGIDRFSAALAAQPEALICAKLIEWLFYCAGQAYRPDRHLHILQSVQSRYEDDYRYLAMLSFAQELSGQLEASRDTAYRALDLHFATPWAHHTLSHYFLRTGQMTLGIEEMRRFQPSWDHMDPLLRGHNTWHLALFYLAMLDQHTAEQLYQTVLWPNPRDAVLTHIDAIALLWRMDMAGFETASHWASIAEKIGHHATDLYTPFNLAHYAYALARVDDQKSLAAMRERLAHFQARQTGKSDWTWTHLCPTFIGGVIAFAQRDFARAAMCLEKVYPDFYAGGGSDAQVEIFVQSTYLAFLRTDEADAAQAVFDRCLAYYQQTPLHEYWLSCAGRLT